MKRLLYQALLKWKKGKKRKPLLLQGARQVGKTFLVHEFAKKEYDELVYLNFEQNSGLQTLFEGNLGPQTIVDNIGLYIGKKIEPKNTLIFFDEIQVAPKALTSLKYFCEQAPEYHVIAAGSLLGVSVGRQTAFPVGKVDFLTLYPMSLIEYLMAFDEGLMAKKLSDTSKIEPLPDILHKKLLDHLKMYLYLGGMPEVLQDYLDNRDIASARKIQNDILQAYERDFAKYTDAAQAIKTSGLWQSLPRQLAKKNKKFKYREVQKNARAAAFAQTIQWLRQAGLIHPAYNISVPKMPISGYADFSKFKLYMLDTGLLGAMLNLTSDIIIRPNALFQEYNGAFIENFVATELIASGNTSLFYWTSKHDAEVDFILQLNNCVYPLEVKSGLSRNLKSLRSYADKYNPKTIIRTSPRNFIQDKDFINIPLYAVFTIMNMA